MKELKIIVEISVEIDGDEGEEGKYAQVFYALDNCGYENGFSFKVLDKELSE